MSACLSIDILLTHAYIYKYTTTIKSPVVLGSNLDLRGYGGAGGGGGRLEKLSIVQKDPQIG